VKLVKVQHFTQKLIIILDLLLRSEIHSNILAKGVV
jgi:hypothetical protein